MGMILTSEDLDAIKQVLVPVVVEAIEQLAQATAAGFDDVQRQINDLQANVDNLKTDMVYTKDKLDSIEHVQQAEVQRSDRHDLVFRKMSHALKTI